MSLLEVLSNIRSSGSGTGVSHYMKRCGAQHYLDKLYPREGGYDAQVGTLIHKLMELYYTRQLDSVAIPLDDMADFQNNPVQEALRAFSAYSQFFPADEFEVVACELQIPEPGTERGRMQAAVLADFVIDPFTFRPDMAVRFNQEQAENFFTRRRITVEPGCLYLMDHKSHGKADSHGVRNYTMGQQVPVYTRAWNAMVEAGVLPYQPCQGMIINNIIRHQNMSPEPTRTRQGSFPTYLLDVGTDHDLAVARAAFARQAQKLAAGEPDITACRDWGICSHFVTGNCDRLKVWSPVDLVQIGGQYEKPSGNVAV